MRGIRGIIAGVLCLLAAQPLSARTTLTIATVNNADMKRMQALAGDFSAKHPDISLRWVVLEENILRQRVTIDIATKSGQFDVVTIGSYEVPIWAKRGWLAPLDTPDAQLDIADFLPSIRAALSTSDRLYASPFYSESSMLFYRKDLFQRVGLSMPDRPNWTFVEQAAKKLTNKSAGIYGICLRGKAGWGENVALLTAMANSFGARWFDESWRAQFDKPEWRRTLTTYVNLMRRDGPPGASSNGFNENLALFNAGKCAMWIDATVAASFVTDPKESKVADRVGFALAPNAGLGKSANWLWVWSLGIPAESKKVEAAKKFVTWATGKTYPNLVASHYGWANVPPGTRTSLYQNSDYLRAAPFAALTLESISQADPNHPTINPIPYSGVQYVTIPEFQGIGTTVGQAFSAALSGALTVDEALAAAQRSTEREMRHARYVK